MKKKRKEEAHSQKHESFNHNILKSICFYILSLYKKIKNIFFYFKLIFF